DVDRRIFLGTEGSRRIRLSDLAHRHPDIATRALDIHLARVWQRLYRRFIDSRGLGDKLRIGVHGAPLTSTPRGAKGPAGQRFPAAALSASGSKGVLSPGFGNRARPGPLRC